uniref:Uncharacterized protein n=1 Tax=Panagrolaimus sp. JU765 TaxID=591449 RepID=A0AC34QA17_9BILA
MSRRRAQVAPPVIDVKPLPTIPSEVYDLYNAAYVIDRRFTADSIRRFVSVTGSIKYSLLVHLIQLFYMEPVNATILRRMLDRQTFSLTPRIVFERHPEYCVEDDPENPKDFIIHKIK